MSSAEAPGQQASDDTRVPELAPGEPAPRSYFARAGASADANPASDMASSGQPAVAVPADDVASAVPAAAPVAAPMAAVATPVTPAARASAPAPVGAHAPAPVSAGMPKVQSFTLPANQLAQIAQSAGLQWVNSDADKVAAVRAAIAAEPKPIHVPRERPALVALDDGPLVLVETRRDLNDVKLAFEDNPGGAPH